MVILLILLVSWMEDPKDVKQDFQVLEYFAGCARIATVAHHCGYESAAHEIDYGASKSKRSGRPSAMDLNSNAGFVIAIKLVLRSKFNAVVAVFAICCSSFVPVNRGTGQRDILVPEGDESVVSVRKANKLVCRILGPFAADIS